MRVRGFGPTCQKSVMRPEGHQRKLSWEGTRAPLKVKLRRLVERLLMATAEVILAATEVADEAADGCG